jgi:hypothetical protein
MAGPLTWRNVDTPDFRPAMEGFAQFSQLLNSGLNQAREGIRSFDNVNTDKVNKAFALELAGIQGEPEEYAAGLQTLLSRYDPARLSYENITAANNKHGQLMDLQMKGLNIQDTKGDLAWEGRGRERTIADDAALDAAAPVFSRLLQAQASDDQATVAQIMGSDEFKAVSAQLKPDQYASLMSKGQNLAQGELGLDGTRLGQTISRTSFNNNQEDRANQQAAQATAFAAIGSVTSPEEFRATIAASDLNPVQRAIAYEIGVNRYGSALQPIPGMASTDAGGVSGSGDPTRIMNYQAAGAGFTTVPDSVKTLGQASDFARQVNRAGVPSSAMGVYQIVGQTLRNYAPRVLGDNWQQAAYSFENQDKIAEAIFNDHRGSADALRRQWVSLTPTEAERVRKLPWEQAREVIARGESSSSPAQISAGQLRQQQAGANTAIANNINGNRILEVQQTLMEGWTDTTPAIDVATSLSGKDGPLAGMSKADLVNRVNRIAQQYSVSPAIAGAIIRRSVGQQDRFNWNGLDSSIRLGELGLEIDENLVKEYGKAFADNDALASAAMVRQRSGDASSTMAAATAQVAALEKQVANLRSLSRTRNVTPQLLEAEAMLAAAKQAALGANAQGYEAGGYDRGQANNIMSRASGGALPGEADLYRRFGLR